MKTLQNSTILFLVAILLSTFSFSQIVVSDKLSTPESELTQKTSRTQVWVSGQWVVSNNEYVWKKGYWTEKRPGYVFMPGYWKKVDGGWTWISGSWKQVNMRQWNNVYA